jgi:dihydrofolate synthase/folylpolyglutamate synthase
MAALVATLQRVPAQRRIAVFSASRDKDVPEMLRIAASFFDRIVLTQYTNNPRATPVSELTASAVAAGVRQFDILESPFAAWQAALQDAGPDDLLCITGSFFLGAQLRALILNEPAGRRPSDPLLL